MATAEKTSSRKVNQLIGNVKRSANAYNKHVQAAIVAIIEHANSFGDCTGAARLLAAMPKSNRRQLVVDHFQQYSPIAVRKNDKGNFVAKLRIQGEDAKFNKFNIEGVKRNNWFERPEAQKLPDVVNYESIRSAMLKFFEGQIKKADNCEEEAEKNKAVAYINAVRSAASALTAPITTYDDMPQEEEVAPLRNVA